ncbi:MAG TPA: hypothetical protein VF131_20740 [Blastocatellia bacterium]|nr:hypothetical protein [Blastocatellia bacterium]
MESFLSKFTLGFLMAQLFPGAVTILAFTCPFVAWRTDHYPTTLVELFRTVADKWFVWPRSVILMLFISAGMGMVIHGIDWMVISMMQYKKNDPSPEDVSVLRDSTPVHHFMYHKWYTGLQIIVLPVIMIIELFFLLTARDLGKLMQRENIPSIHPNHKQNFDFLQDFYLYFAQFYLHMGYAFLFSIFPLVSALIAISKRSGQPIYYWPIIACYFGSSIFFLIGRVQIATLFNAERQIRERSQWEGIGR